MSIPELIKECEARGVDISHLERRGSCSKRLDLAVAITRHDEAQSNKQNGRLPEGAVEQHVRVPLPNGEAIVRFIAFGGNKQVVADFGAF